MPRSAPVPPRPRPKDAPSPFAMCRVRLRPGRTDLGRNQPLSVNGAPRAPVPRRTSSRRYSRHDGQGRRSHACRRVGTWWNPFGRFSAGRVAASHAPDAAGHRAAVQVVPSRVARVSPVRRDGRPRRRAGSMAPPGRAAPTPPACRRTGRRFGTPDPRPPIPPPDPAPAATSATRASSPQARDGPPGPPPICVCCCACCWRLLLRCCCDSGLTVSKSAATLIGAYRRMGTDGTG